MKNLFLMAIMLVSLTTQAQSKVELKGYTLGSTSATSEKITTLGGIDGVIQAFKINDGRIYQLIFIPSNDGSDVQRVYQSSVDKIVKGMENKYGITFKKKYPNKYDDDNVTYSCVSDGCFFFITCDGNQYMSPPIEMGVVVQSNALSIIAEREEQVKANSDF